MDNLRICEWSSCDIEADLHVCKVESRSLVKKGVFCERHAFQIWSNGSSVDDTDSLPDKPYFQFDIECLFTHLHDRKYTVFLRELGGDRRFGMPTGYCQLGNLRNLLEYDVSPVQSTHAAMLKSIRELGGELTQVIIHDYEYESNTYFAKLCLRRGEGDILIDIRATDGLSCAVAGNAPILVERNVLVKKLNDRPS